MRYKNVGFIVFKVLALFTIVIYISRNLRYLLKSLLSPPRFNFKIKGRRRLKNSDLFNE